MLPHLSFYSNSADIDIYFIEENHNENTSFKLTLEYG